MMNYRQNTHQKSSGMVAQRLQELLARQMSPLDLLPHDDLREKFIDLVINGEQKNSNPEIAALFSRLGRAITEQRVERTKVVVFGGGTGLSNIIGGDCRAEGWTRNPFTGLKEIFPHTRSVVCVTDDGGSTGELLKDLPLIAIGDIRHVLLSSVQLGNLQRQYRLSVLQSHEIAGILARLFNFRFTKIPGTADEAIFQSGADMAALPKVLRDYLQTLITNLFADQRLAATLRRCHCLGNLIIVSAIFKELGASLSIDEIRDSQRVLHEAIYSGLCTLSVYLGTEQRAVLPCTSTLSQLRIRYTNGIQTTGEAKSSVARRGFPVDSVHVDFCDEVRVYPEVLKDIAEADILVLAPGSLYSSIIPIFKVPGLAQAVRENTHALKILVSNLWVQAGETDLSIVDPERKFHLSDLIKAYERNIPGGTSGLFHEVLCLSLKDVPASVIQSYAVEGKIPIYLDREIVNSQGYAPVECGIYSKEALAERGVIQHDPATLAKAVKALLVGRSCFTYDTVSAGQRSVEALEPEQKRSKRNLLPCVKYSRISKRLAELYIECSGELACAADTQKIRDDICDIIWKHHDIPLSHLDYTKGIRCVDLKDWRRDQQWDNVYSFYDPSDKLIKIRRDQFAETNKLEIAFLIALGESLLGRYAREKVMRRVEKDGVYLGKAYHLSLHEESARDCFFSGSELSEYLQLARMCPTRDENHYTRLINGKEGFTPPGLLMGLMYTWYLENRLASHIEYKMTVMKIPQTDLIPEQKKMVGRRMKIITFFRDVVFR